MSESIGREIMKIVAPELEKKLYDDEQRK